jgi:predicted acyl esterase
MKQPASPDAAAPDRPWRRPGAAGYALGRLRGLARSPVDVYRADRTALVIDNNVAIPMRDQITLRANVYRPVNDGPFAALLCAHPYGKDNLPTKKKRRRGYSVSIQYRLLRQPARLRFSDLTGWEAPDPAWWTQRGFAVINCDLRGAGRSDGVGALLSDEEAADVYDVIEWAARQPWCTGAVGMIGVSYLAISQWKAAALRPPHLKAIVPWEGFTDAYRDFARAGGIRENGFLKLWSRNLKSVRLKYNLGEETAARPLRDEWWQALVPNLPKIEVPALICGSFSDNNLHSRGSVRAFEQISSPQRHLYTHRGGKWETFYSSSALDVQLAFLDRHLRDGAGTPQPRVRLEVREDRDHIVEVREETSWPLASTNWTARYLGAGGLLTCAPEQAGSITFDTHSGGACFGWTMDAETEITGPSALRLFVEVHGGGDVDLFAGVEKWRGRKYVPFEGSYGFGRDRITSGWLKASMRALDATHSRPFEPLPALDRRDPVQPGEVVQVDIPLGPSATLFRAGEQLRLVVAGRWLWPRNPLTGQFPSAYERGPRCRCTLHWGPDHAARLLVAVIA